MENQTNNQILFVDGMYSNEVSPNAPDFILGSLSIQPEKLALWLQANLALKNEKGYINLTVKRSKAGKRFISVDTYKKKQEPQNNEAMTLDDIQIQPAFDLPDWDSIN
jgi:hypothetical protein